ncbi:MAG: phosphate regulon sensor histidine kinase PhoR [Pseudoxanthomonas suwonensis]|nr:phosphate regulon sensor histidine kinase PhoR [Pseudoxanthomonas suwonensis]
MPAYLQSAWSRTLGQLLLVLLAALLVGLLVDRVWFALAITALGIVAWHYWRMRQVLMRLTARRRLQPPSGVGIWNELDRLLFRSQNERRARKQRLMDMLRAYSAAAAALPDAIVVVERESGQIAWFNDAAGPLLGLEHPGDLGSDIVQRLQPLPLGPWLALGQQAEPMLDVASPVGSQLRMNLRLIPYSDTLWLLVARDVSKMMRLEQTRRDFVANVSHELRTPLTVLHGYLDMVDDEDHPELSTMFAEMRLQTERMNQLVEDLLKLSRLEVQEAVTDEVVSMPSLLATLRREAEALSQGRHQITLDAAFEANLRGSNKELHSAFSNLVSNAVRYTPSGGRIEIAWRPLPGGGGALSVQDSGYGIPAAHLPRISERFYRVSTSRSRESGGTGLGLAIAKHILHLHQGRLLIESEVGRGSTFTCCFGPDRVLVQDAALPPPPVTAGARG